jgi:nucleoid-associated protein YgaU
MKRFFLFVVLVAAAGLQLLPAQSLVENSYYKRSMELHALATQSFNDGDYDAAADYAEQAKQYAGLSDSFVEKMLAMTAADKSIAAAKARLAKADAVNAKAGWPTEYGRAADSLSAAIAAYGTEDYAVAKAKADESAAAFDALADAMRQRADAQAAAAASPAPAAGPVFPAIYTVRLIPERRDCLWRIAGYSFIYNNPLKWTVIYEANKKTFRDPSNPNLIFPGQLLQIPSIAGEARSGTYDPKASYPTLQKK